MRLYSFCEYAVNTGSVNVAKHSARGMANPIELKPVSKQDGLLQVIIETPKGCRNKFAFDPEQKVFALKKVLPAGMSFPTTSDSFRRPSPRTAIRLTFSC